MSTNFTNPKDRKRQLNEAQETAEKAAALAAQLEDRLAQLPEAPPPAMPAGVALTPEQFSQLLGAIGSQAGRTDVGMLQEVMRQAREPIPEVKIHHGISHYRPGGRDVHVAPFRWPEVWFAIRDDKGNFHPNKPFDWERCTAEEIAAINALTPGVRGKVTFADGALHDVAVVEERSTAGEAKRLLIAFDANVFADPQRRNMIGSLTSLCGQLAKLPVPAAA